MVYKVLAAVLLSLILAAPLALAAGDQGRLKVGGPFPATEFQAPEDMGQRAYLGLKPGEGLDPTKVDARLVIVEVLNIYCPHCQRQAPKVNALYDLIQKKGWGDQVKMVGIGASNTGEEVAGYVRHYKVPFPVVPDYKVKCAELLGTVYTPYFVVLERLPGGGNRVLYAASGDLPPSKKFLEDMAAQAGIH